MKTKPLEDWEEFQLNLFIQIAQAEGPAGDALVREAKEDWRAMRKRLIAIREGKQ